MLVSHLVWKRQLCVCLCAVNLHPRNILSWHCRLCIKTKRHSGERVQNDTREQEQTKTNDNWTGFNPPHRTTDQSRIWCGQEFLLLTRDRHETGTKPAAPPDSDAETETDTDTGTGTTDLPLLSVSRGSPQVLPKTVWALSFCLSLCVSHTNTHRHKKHRNEERQR